jgi:hypothetical protein
VKRDGSAGIVLAMAVLLVACSPLPVAVSCDERLSQQECDDVATFSFENRRDEAAALGEVREISTTLIDDCPRAARAEFTPALADPSFDRCLRVDTRWQRGQTTWLVARQGADGALRVVE